MLEGIKIVLSEAIPRDQLWFLPRDMAAPRVGAPGERTETIEEWAARVLEAAKRGEVSIIKGLKVDG